MAAVQTRPRSSGDGTSDAPAGDSHDERERKQQVLTKGRASAVQSIADAVVAKDGEPFFLCEPDGEVPVDGHHGYGLYHHDCRFLAGYELTLGGQRPDALAATESARNTLVIEVTNPDIGDGSAHIPKEQIGVTWTRRVDDGGPALARRARLPELRRRIRGRAGRAPVRRRLRGRLHHPRPDGPSAREAARRVVAARRADVRLHGRRRHRALARDPGRPRS